MIGSEGSVSKRMATNVGVSVHSVANQGRRTRNSTASVIILPLFVPGLVPMGSSVADSGLLGARWGPRYPIAS